MTQMHAALVRATIAPDNLAALEAEIREQIAAELENCTTGPIGQGSGLRYIRSDIAARIARGES